MAAEDLKTKLEIEGKDLASKEFQKAKASVKDLEDNAVSANKNVNASFKTAALSVAKYAAAYVSLGAVISFLKESKAAGIENEQEVVDLRRQVEATGLSWEKYGDQINGVIQRQAKYGVITGTETSQVLRALILNTNDVSLSMQHLGLVQDLAAAKSSLSLASAADLVGRALQGDITMLARYIPALRIAAAELGENASASDKAALAVRLLTERVGGAATTIDANIKSIRESSVAWEELKDAVGGVFLEIIGSGDTFTKALRSTEKFFLKLRQVIKDGVDLNSIPALEVQLTSLQRHEQTLKLLDIFPDISIFEERNRVLKDQINRLRLAQDQIAARIHELKPKPPAAIDKTEEAAQRDAANRQIFSDRVVFFKRMEELEIQANFATDGRNTETVQRHLAFLGRLAALSVEARTAELFQEKAAAEERIGILGEAAAFEVEAKLAADSKTREAFLARIEFLRAAAVLEKEVREEDVTNEGERQERLGAMIQRKAALQIAVDKLEAESARKLSEQKIQAAQDAFSAAANFSNALFIFTGQNNRKLFEATKAFNIAQTIMNTYAGATKAFVDPGGIPGKILAASIMATGLANVARISATSMGGGGGIGGAGGGGTPLIGANPAGPLIPQTQSQPNIEVTVIMNDVVDASAINWDRFSQGMSDSLGRHLGQGGSSGPVNIAFARA